jgi:hypothetical protein
MFADAYGCVGFRAIPVNMVTFGVFEAVSGVLS